MNDDLDKVLSSFLPIPVSVIKLISSYYYHLKGQVLTTIPVKNCPVAHHTKFLITGEMTMGEVENLKIWLPQYLFCTPLMTINSPPSFFLLWNGTSRVTYHLQDRKADAPGQEELTLLHKVWKVEHSSQQRYPLYLEVKFTNILTQEYIQTIMFYYCRKKMCSLMILSNNLFLVWTDGGSIGV